MPDTKQTILLPLLTLALLATGGALLLDYVNKLTREDIRNNERKAMLQILSQIIPGPDRNTNDVFNDLIEITEPGYFGTNRKVSVFRSRADGDALGVIYYPVIAEAYNGPVELAIGVSQDGTLSGVRVMRQDETVGLGAEVDQQNSDWIFMFNGLSFRQVPEEEWTVRSENGYFDQISGATITSRSVINAVKNTLDYHQLAGETLYK
jgi:electron transport complex protein RnfG